jgi:hypothetical protein
VYFANSNFTILYIISYDMVMLQYMFNYGVSSKLLGVGDGGHVVTQNVHMVAHARKHPKIDDKLA